MSSTTRARASRVAVLATAGALAITLVPAVQSAQAAVVAPKFAYLSAIAGDAALSTAAASGGAGNQATPAGYQTFGYDASADGKTWAACMSAGAASADAYDRTYALVLTHDDGSTVSTRVLSTFCEANPVVSADGSTVYWYADDTVYKYAATYAGGTISGTPSAVSTGQFVKKTDSAGDPIEDLQAFAVSADGTNAAVMLTTGTVSRVRSAAMTTSATKPAVFEKSYASTSTAATVYMPKPYSFTFVDANTFVFDVVNIKQTSSPKTIVAVTGDTPAAASASGTVATPYLLAPALNDTYDLREYNGTFFAWRDVYSGSTFVETQWTTATVTGAPSTWTVDAPDTLRKRDNGDSTYRYIPVAASLPDLQPAINKAAAHPTFALSTSVAVYRSKLPYQSFNLYLQDPLGGAYAAAAAAEVDKGTLEWSTNNGASWISLGSTSGKNVFAIGTKWYNGYTPVLARNTAFRWTFPGDYFTQASTAVVRSVKVVPIITVKKSVSGAYTTVYGSATRKGGTAVLQRSTSLGWRTVTSTTLSSTGVFTFGKRALVKGTYRIVTTADTSWAAGVKNFVV